MENFRSNNIYYTSNQPIKKEKEEKREVNEFEEITKITIEGLVNVFEAMQKLVTIIKSSRPN